MLDEQTFSYLTAAVRDWTQLLRLKLIGPSQVGVLTAAFMYKNGLQQNAEQCTLHEKGMRPRVHEWVLRVLQILSSLIMPTRL